MGKSITRADLCKDLQSKGFSVRSAHLILNVILDTIIEKIKKKEEVDLPIGKMKLVQPESKRAYRFGKIVKTYTKSKVHFRRKD